MNPLHNPIPPFDASREILRERFTSLSDADRPHTLWHWMNGHVGRGAITRDLEAMKAAGLGGFMLWNTSEGIPPGPVDYMSPEWWALLGHTIDEADRLGLEMKMFNGAGWSSSGGPWVTPDRAMREVAWTETCATGPAEFDAVLDIPVPAIGIERDMKRDPVANRRYYVDRESVRGHYRDIRILAFPTPPGERAGTPWLLADWREKAGFAKPRGTLVRDERQPPAGDAIDPFTVIDLSDSADADGRLRWSVPPGAWTILRIGHQPTGRQNHPAPLHGRGLEIDKHTATAADFFWDHSIRKFLEVAGDRVGRTFLGIHIDSFEVGHQNWSEAFAEAFQRGRGYDIHPHLIALTGRVLGCTDSTEDFLWDFRRTIGDLIVRNYFGRFAARCQEKGVALVCEPYGHYGNTNDHEVAAIPDIPMCEFWALRDTAYHSATAKLASSAAHTKGREIADAEAFTGFPGFIFEENPASMKAQGDNFLCDGINRFSFHTFAHDPYEVGPGLGLGSYGSRFDRRNTWWPFIRPWMDYLARCHGMLREGTFVADFLCYAGEDAPKHALLRSAIRPAIPDGHDFDFCDVGTLLDLNVRDGLLALPAGMTYRVLIMPPSTTMSLRVIEKIRALVSQGAVVVGPRPVRAPGLAGKAQTSERFARIAEDLWPDKTTHGTPQPAGRVIDTDDLSAVASALGWKPDFLADGDGLRYLHRRADGIDIYFVSNQTNEARTVQATFRVDGKQPEFWFPDSGHTLPVRDFQSTGDGRTSLTIPLDPVGSVFVVFSGQPAALPAKPTRMQEVLRELIPLTGPWEVAFQAGRGAPAALVMDVLSDLSLHADERVRYFAGEATYQTTFDWDMQLPAQAGDCVMLDLGAVHVVCDVTLNEHDLGILWKPPFQVDVTRFLKPGKNELTVRVANLWVNRLLGDLRQPDDCEWTTDTGSTAAGEGLARIPAWVTKGGARPATGRVAFAAWRWQHHTPEKPLLPSGLAGPVRLLWKGAPSPSCTRKNG